MALVYDDFLTKFPELSSADPLRVEALIDQIQNIENRYSGLESEAKTDHAIALHVAHLLTLYTQAEANGNAGSRVVKYKSKQDEIQFQPLSGTGMFDYEATVYGKRLKAFIDLQPLFLNCYY